MPAKGRGVEAARRRSGGGTVRGGRRALWRPQQLCSVLPCGREVPRGPDARQRPHHLIELEDGGVSGAAAIKLCDTTDVITVRIARSGQKPHPQGGGCIGGAAAAAVPVLPPSLPRLSMWQLLLSHPTTTTVCRLHCMGTSAATQLPRILLPPDARRRLPPWSSANPPLSSLPALHAPPCSLLGVKTFRKLWRSCMQHVLACKWLLKSLQPPRLSAHLQAICLLPHPS